MAVMLPSVLLSGYVFPLSSLPIPLQVISHILPAYPLVTSCELYATTPTPGCDAHFSSSVASAAAARAPARTAAAPTRPVSALLRFLLR